MRNKGFERVVMVGHYSKKALLQTLFSLSCMMSMKEINALSSLARNDPYPVFSTLDPHTFLYRSQRLVRRIGGWDGPLFEHISLSVSPFGQNANYGRDNVKNFAQLGDLQGDPTGRTNMIALLLGPTPIGQTLPPTLVAAQQALFPGQQPPIISTPLAQDPLYNFGFFSFPLRYRKRGVRFDLSAEILCDFGINIQTGVADICQTVSAFNDLTCQTIFNCSFLPEITGQVNPPIEQQVENLLMKQIKEIARELHLDLKSFHNVSLEEVRFNLFWRHAFDINYDRPDWPYFLFIPFWVASGSISPGKRLDPFKQFGAIFGNNGYDAVGATAGALFNFIETIEIGAEVGYTHFFDRCVPDLRVPNHPCQSGIFPFFTNVRYQPGHNWHFSAKLASYYFLDRLSFSFEYVQIDHGPDHIHLLKPDPAFLPEDLEKIMTFKAKVANIRFNYDISPNITLGALWQTPLSQQNAYRSTTILLGLNIIL